MSDSTTAATQQLPPREGLQAAKRRWKVLKRCDQNDPQIKSEIDQIEKDFPEILGLPAPVLSKATRATLEGGAVVSAIENETASSAATATTPEELEAADAAKKKEDEVKEKLSQLQNMVKNLEKETNQTNTVESVKPEETQQEPTSTDKKSSSPSPSSPVNQQNNNNNNQKYLEGAMMAFQAYDSFFVSTLPSQIAPDQAEASSALFFAALVVVGQFVTSTGTTTLSSSLSGSGGRNSLCDNIVIYLLNPVLWCLPVVLMRMFRLEMAKCKSLVDGVAIVLATGVRFVLVGVCAFTVYSMLFLMLQAVGGVHVPRRFCPE